jgi:hypothetical protein
VLPRAAESSVDFGSCWHDRHRPCAHDEPHFRWALAYWYYIALADELDRLLSLRDISTDATQAVFKTVRVFSSPGAGVYAATVRSKRNYPFGGSIGSLN